jgi:hypothetical protein
MQQSQPNIAAIVRSEQRFPRFRYHHTLAGAAHELGIPTGWVWYWFHKGRLDSQNYLRAIWVKIADVRGLLADHLTVYDAFYATREPISDPKTIREVLTRWRNFPKQMYVSEVAKRPAASMVPFPAVQKEAL